jgi:hypothetical protein
MSTPASRLTYRTRDVVLDLAAYELRRNGRPVRLERQPMELSDPYRSDPRFAALLARCRFIIR